MKGNQTPQKELTRSSDVNRKSKESQLKNRKIAKKNLTAAFTSVSEDASPEITKELTDSSLISEISDANYSGENVESFAQGLNPPPSAIPETFTLSDLSPCLTITTKEVVDVSAECNGFNRLSNPKIRPVDAELDEFYIERDWLDKLILEKVWVLFLCFLVWVLVVSMIFFFSSGSRGSFAGPLPT